jgi:hypothetical protein
MMIFPATLLFAMLGVASARVGESVDANDQERVRIESDFNIPKNMNVTPDGGGGTLALGGLNDNIRVMVGFRNIQGKLTAIATEASELITEFKTVDVLTMIIPSSVLGILANDPDIE